MQTIRFLALTAFAALWAHADFSYITVSRTPAGVTTIKHYIKGQRTIEDNGSTVTVMDFESQTETTIDKNKRTYSVKPFSQLASNSAAAGLNMHADVKKTGQHRNINGFDAEETVMTMLVSNSQSKQPGAKTQMEYDVWLASDVPGIEEMRGFYQKNADRMPWAAMAGGNPGIAEIQRAVATSHGIAVLTTVKMKNAENSAKMAQLQAQIDEMRKQGGPQAAMADKLSAQMGSSAPFVTSESSGFSASPVPDSVFAIPAGYQKVDN